MGQRGNRRWRRGALKSSRKPSEARLPGMTDGRSKSKGPGEMPRPFGSRWVGWLDRAGGMARDRVDLAAADVDVSEFAVIEPHQLFVGPLVSAPALVEPDDGSPEQHVQSPSFSRGTAWNRPASWFA